MRDTWNTRTAFILASIGSAIGLGNIWRFPYVCYDNGGGAFLVAYAICLFVVGIPLLMLEFAVGQRSQQTGPGAFKQIHPRLEWFGWIATGIAFVIVVYYAVVMSYCVNYTFQSFTLGWGENPGEYFTKRLLGITESAAVLGNFRWPVFGGLILGWIGIIACVWHGTRTVSKVIYVTVLVPWVLLVIFVIRGVTLPGAGEGLAFYLRPDWSKLLTFKIWLDAVTQVAFSLSVGFAVMLAYGSFLKRDADIVQNAFVIGIADGLTAFISGFAVFGALGHKAFLEGAEVATVVKSGPGLAFVTYPEIINNLPLAPVFGFLFFAMLLLLAIDSAFSIVEAVTGALHDKWGWDHKQCNFTVAAVALLLGVPLCFGGGIHILDITDRFMTQMGITIVALGECLIVGYVLGAHKMREYLNVHSIRKAGQWWDVCVRYVIPIAIMIMFGNELIERIKEPYLGDRGVEFVYGWRTVALVLLISIILTNIKSKKQLSEQQTTSTPTKE